RTKPHRPDPRLQESHLGDFGARAEGAADEPRAVDHDHVRGALHLHRERGQDLDLQCRFLADLPDYGLRGVLAAPHPSPGKRARPEHALTRLPRRGYVIQEKHLRRFRSLTVRPDADFAGLVHMGEDGNEIWVEAGLSEPEKRFTIVHELVHARRQRAEEELRDERLEEAIVE